MLNALTIDVEEHFQAHAYEKAIDRGAWESQPSRVRENTARVLELLAAHGVRATFFVLGWVADRHPQLVRDIAAAGHEVASHGYAHQLVYRQSAADFAADLARSLRALRRALDGTGSPVVGYRAPAFSLTDDAAWALDVLRAQGLRYDSSILPVTANGRGIGGALRSGKRYGMRGASRFAVRLDGGLWEFPVSTLCVARRNWPVAGGGYFRLYPLWLTRHAIRRINAEGHPAVVYLHPWEFDPHPPAVRAVSGLARFRHDINRGRTAARLRALLRELPFGPLREVFASHLATG